MNPYRSTETKFVKWDTKLWFGKYLGQTMERVYKKNPGYIKWCIEKSIFEIIGLSDVLEKQGKNNSE
jgi:hypothetical protein